MGRKDVLKHPVAETFLFLKWRRIRKFFVLSFIYHALFITLYSLYILRKYSKLYLLYYSSRYMSFDYLLSFIAEIFLCEDVTCDVPSYVRPIQYLIIILNLCFMSKEIFQACLDWSAYIRQWENWLQCLIIVGVFLCTVSILCMSMTSLLLFLQCLWDLRNLFLIFSQIPWDVRNGVVLKDNTSNWQHDVAAVTIFFCWLELMMIIGRFPTFGLYVQMFTTGMKVFLISILLMLQLLISYYCMLVSI